MLERHLGTGRVGLGFVRGFGLARGAFGATLAHDAHNLIVVGVDDEAMATRRRHAWPSSAAESSSPTRTGSARSCRCRSPGSSPTGRCAEVLDASRAINAAVQELGVAFPHPFQVLAFLALSVIPSLKITDRGLVDVDRFELVPLAV